MPHTHRNEALTHGKSTKCKKLPRKEKAGELTPPRPVADRRRHPPHLLLRLCPPKPPRQTRAQPVPRQQGGEAGQPPARCTPCAQGPAAPQGTYRAGAPPRPPLPAVGVGAAAAAPRGVPQRGSSARRGAGESAQPRQCGFPLRFVSLLLQTTPANPRSRAVLRPAAVRGLSNLPAPPLASQLVLCRGHGGRGGNALILLLGCALTSWWSPLRVRKTAKTLTALVVSS